MNKLLFNLAISVSILAVGCIPSCATPDGSAPENPGSEQVVSDGIVSPTGQDASLVPPPQAEVEADIKANECPPKEVTCPEIFSPTYCNARAYKEADLPDDEVIRAWGENSCSAKLALASEACRLGKSPSFLGGVECVPDVSQGKCPATRKICTMEVNPVVCNAAKYGAQILSEKNVVSAYGSNECDGRNNLMQQACIKNLDPGKLGSIKCRAPQ